MKTVFRILIILVLLLSSIPNVANAATSTHEVVKISITGDTSRNTISIPVEKAPREKKLDLVIVQDLSGSFRDTYSNVANELKQAIDLMSPVIDRSQFIGYTSIKASDTDLPIYNDPKTTLEAQNEGQYNEFFNVLYKNEMTHSLTDTKATIDNVTTKQLYGNGTPTAYGIQEALEDYQANNPIKESNRETLFLVVTDGFPNGDIDGKALTPSTSMVQLLGPTTGINAALSHVTSAGYLTSFGLWQNKVSLEAEWGASLYNNYNNYINTNVPNFVSRSEFFFNMNNNDNSIGEFASEVKDIIQTNLNDQLSISEKVSAGQTYVAGSAKVENSAGQTIAIPAPYQEPTFVNQTLTWNLDALPEGEYTVTFDVTGKVPVSSTPSITAEDITLSEGAMFDPIQTVNPTATDTASNNLTSKIRVKANDVDTSKPGVYHVTYEVMGELPANANQAISLIDSGEITYRDALLKTLEKLDFVPSVTRKVATKTIKVTVTGKPIIEAKDHTIYVGDNFDPLAEVSAKDAKDGDLTGKLELIKNDVDNMTPGVYDVTYQVTNSVGESTTKTIQVTVLSKPIIEAKDHTIYVGDNFDPLAEVSAKDAKDGDLTGKLELIKNDVDNMTPGVYDVTYQVTNSVGESTTKTIQVTVLSKPIIEAKDHTIYVGDNFDPLAEVSAKDAKDGDLTGKLELIKNDVDNMTPGVYDVTYQVTNSVGESTTKTIQVTVLSKPIIEAKNHTIYVGDNFDPLAEVSAKDAKDGDLTGKLELIKNDVDNMTPGVYDVTYQVTNSVGESTTKTIQVTVLSKPIIEAKDHTIYVGDNFDPLAEVSAKDAKDGDLTGKLELIKNDVDNMTPGIYEVTYQVTNSVGESAVITVKVTVLERAIIPEKVNPEKPEKPVNPEKPTKPVLGVAETPIEKVLSVESNTIESERRLPKTGDSNGPSTLIGLGIIVCTALFVRRRIK
ncbi:Bacterial Ig-like domain (group 3) [Listeria newyorkensis]|nr:Bacterial Ig-like domain (group 3) [Listeria newyorkensis]